jgi:hypothetical protein
MNQQLEPPCLWTRKADTGFLLPGETDADLHGPDIKDDQTIDSNRMCIGTFHRYILIFVQAHLPPSIQKAVWQISDTICASWPHPAQLFVEESSAHFCLSTPEAFTSSVFKNALDAQIQTEINLGQVECFCNTLMGIRLISQAD